MARTALPLLLCVLVSPGAGAADRASVVMIISDDQAYTDFGFMGHPLVQTPHLDRLAAVSARYPNACVPSSVCRPSLATLLTGLYPHQHGIHFNHPPPGNSLLSKMGRDEFNRARGRAEELIRSVPTLPRLLAEAGYRCLQTGKHWEGHYRTAGFTDGMTLARASPEPAYGNITLPDGSLVAHGNGDAGLNIGRTTMRPIYDFLEEHGQEPFFIWYAPFLPHQPHDAPQRYVDLYAGNPKVPRHCVPYYAACTWFDDTVGALIDCLEKRGLAERTIFVFVVDNGWEPTAEQTKQADQYAVNTRSKRSPFDLGLRTPILIRWDGHVVPATHDALLSSVDIVPTLLAAVGLGQKASAVPGVNLLPSACGERPLESRPVFGEIYPGDATSLGHPERDVSYRWIRRGDYKLIVPHAQQGTIWREYVTKPSLFNVIADPREEHDLGSDPQQARRIQHMRKLLDAWWTPGDEPERSPRPTRSVPHVRPHAEAWGRVPKVACHS